MSTWPLPALLAWALAWGLHLGLTGAAAPAWLAMATASLLGAALAAFDRIARTPWRRVFVAAGFPLSLAASGLASGLPAWAWLAPLALLLLLYPLNTWRDAPVFPTPPGALEGLAAMVPLPARAQVLDAGCGLGAGLRELHRVYPDARLTGIEWSWPLRLLCGWRCRFATVTRGDIWAADWSAHDLVYLFQRPESMPRAADKAGRELRPGAWLASLEFEAAQLVPQQVHHTADGRPVWLYRAPLRRRGEDRRAASVPGPAPFVGGLMKAPRHDPRAR